MHPIDLATTNSLRPTSPLPASIQPCFKFTGDQQELTPSIAELVAQKTAQKEFFYGIEIMAQNEGKAHCVDFHDFLPLLPSFISFVWLKQFTDAIRRTGNFDDVTSIQLIPQLNSHIAAMPHLSLYRLTQQHVDAFAALNLSNVLVVRGDSLDEQQDYRYAYQVVEYLRRVRGDNISIAVGGYPEGYTSLTSDAPNKTQDMKYLKQKIDVGANLIITQLCYSGDKIIEFIKDARSAGITAPILVGIIVPYSFSNYQIIERITGVRLSPEARIEVEQLSSDDTKVKNYFVQLMVRIIQQILEADLGIYGIQFFTLNHIEPTVEVLRELRLRGIPKETAADD
ncbi:methylenetetrahydrofolate reductase (NADPH)-like [Drosophila nasuta]|uniref:methylenetetrahydrofolate reductase (NADPH)-like n=1 Tax=Drosophila nasuta TaxID=42062 RepID=UPI00295F4D49|nr:methylenetetrahydrofolate reductase (NADPH)-like [Drosophila nasuta]